MSCKVVDIVDVVAARRARLSLADLEVLANLEVFADLEVLGDPGITEISRKMIRFSHLFASIISQTTTKHIPRPFQSIGETKILTLHHYPVAYHI